MGYADHYFDGVLLPRPPQVAASFAAKPERLPAGHVLKPVYHHVEVHELNEG